MLVPLLALILLPPATLAQGGLLETRLHLEGRHPYEEMGSFVAGAGDVNADGLADLLVGVPGARDRLGRRSAMLVLSGANGRLLHAFYGRPNATWNVAAAAGDVDRDGYGDLLLGCPGASPSAALHQAGGAVLFSGRTGAPILEFQGSSVQGWLGDAVAGAGDVNADGVPDLLVGERGASGGGFAGAGAAHVYSGADGALLLSFHGANPRDYFGSALCAAGDVNADGHGDLLLFAPRADPNGLSDAGSAFVHSGADGRLLYSYHGNCPSAYLENGAGIGDVDADGCDDFLLGAAYAGPNGRRGNGAAYVYSGASGALLCEYLGSDEWSRLGGWVGGGADQDGDGTPDFCYLTTTFVISSIHWISGASLEGFFRMDEPGAHLLGAVAVAGDVDGDGPAEIVIGDPSFSSNGELQIGAVKVLGMDPMLRAGSHELSVAAGGRVEYALAFPISFAGGAYQILGSSHGTGEAWFRDLLVPLVADDFFRRTANGRYGAHAVGFRGHLDAAGRAQARLRVPAGGLPAGLAGKTLHFAAAAQEIGGRSLSSIPLALRLLP